MDNIRLLIDRARTVFSPDHPLAVQPSILLFTLISDSNATRITFSTPKMDCVRSVASDCAMVTFTGSLDFLDSQSTFHLIFGSNLAMICLSQRGNHRCATEDTEYLSNKLRAFFQYFQLHIFCDVV